MKLGEDRSMDVESISTGSLALDVALGASSLPVGRIVEFIKAKLVMVHFNMPLNIYKVIEIERYEPVHIVS